jgi:eukaryotic-like serine/threonine-protein kinase
MTGEQWQRAWDIYAAAVDLAGEEQRRYLDSLRADPEVIDEVTSMIEEARGPSTEWQKPPSRSGTKFGRYEVGEMLSSGGMAEVYSAADPELGRKVAIKFLRPRTTSGPAVEQLIGEAKAASALNHPNIITVYEVIRTGDDVALAMELVEGRALRSFCGRPAEIVRVIDWGRQIAQALGAAHRRDIVHRDVKPENLMVRDDGIVKVLDFGLAGHSDREESLALGGTLSYMSPEQARGERTTAASDVFSLGLVLYELATGAHPFRAASPLDTARAITCSEPKPPSSLNPAIPASFDALLMRMLSKDPRQRPLALDVDRQLSLAALPGRRRRLAAVAWAAVTSAIMICGALAYAFRGQLLSTSEPQFLQLTRQVNENRVTTAAISPDGKTLLYATIGGPVYRHRLSDGNSQPLDALKGLRVDRMVWFNDGSRVLIDGSLAGALDRYEPGIWVMPAKGGALEQVASSARNGTPSPDGSQIAFTSADGSDLFVASSNGRKRRQIRGGGDTISFSSLVWSPNGKRIAFQRSEYVPPAELDSDPAASLTVRRYGYSYESVDADSGRLAASARDFIMASACGLRDGSVLFLRNTIQLPFVYRLWKLRADLDTGKLLDKPRLYTQTDYQLNEISSSADGKVVVAVRGVNGHPNIYVADLPPATKYPRFTGVRRLTFIDADEYPHTWTPDSRAIIFESNRNGNFDLFRQEVDQNDARPLVVSKSATVLPHVSPDGRWILYNQRHEARWNVMRIPLGGGSAETILPDAMVQGEYACSTRPDGRCVYRTVENRQFVFRELDPVRGKGGELARAVWSPSVISDWDISSDGSQVAVPNHDPRHAQIRVTPLDRRGGTAGRVVTIPTLRNLSGVVWAADGRGWYVSAWDGARGLLLYVDLDGRVLTRLMESMATNYAVPSPDGRHVAFTDWTVNANVWRVSGL